jgi:hypothetical protein
MHFSSTDANVERQRRSWLVEVLVVVGILGFGYFALVVEQAPQPVATEQATH